ncbi:MAG: hypothetical protein AAF639_21150 [Chloroflexota bacterium]
MSNFGQASASPCCYTTHIGTPEHDNTVASMITRMETSYAEFHTLVRKVRDEDLWATEFLVV